MSISVEEEYCKKKGVQAFRLIVIFTSLQALSFVILSLLIGRYARVDVWFHDNDIRG
jgi:hypothetical protein